MDDKENIGNGSENGNKDKEDELVARWLEEHRALVENAGKTLHAGFEAIERGETTFICPVCGGQGRCHKSSYNGHRGVQCPTCNVAVQE